MWNFGREIGNDNGMVTVEAAIAIATIVAVLLVSITAIVGVATYLRCVDVAREVALLLARNHPEAKTIGVKLAPKGAAIGSQENGTLVTVTVQCKAAIITLPQASATAVKESVSNQ